MGVARGRGYASDSSIGRTSLCLRTNLIWSWREGVREGGRGGGEGGEGGRERGRGGGSE